MPRYVLGVDGGGTKTHVAIVDETGQLRGTGLGGPSNYDQVGIPTTTASIGEAAEEARRLAGLNQTPLDAVFLGMAGVVSEKDRDIIRDIVQELGLTSPERVDVDHDCRAALAGGLTGRPGIVLIAGTGSSCFGMNAAGEGWRTGGWGHMLDDVEGSSYWLGLKAMKMACCAYDGRIGATLLLERVQRALNLADMLDIMHYVVDVGMSVSEIAALAPLVIEAALEGDAVALDLIHTGTQELADWVLAAAKRLGFTDGPVELALVGGLFRAGDIYLQPLREAVLARLPQCRLTFPELPPVLGACVLALPILNIPIDDTIVRAMRHNAEQMEAG